MYVILAPNVALMAVSIKCPVSILRVRFANIDVTHNHNWVESHDGCAHLSGCVHLSPTSVTSLQIALIDLFTVCV